MALPMHSDHATRSRAKLYLSLWCLLDAIGMVGSSRRRLFRTGIVRDFPGLYSLGLDFVIPTNKSSSAHVAFGCCAFTLCSGGRLDPEEQLVPCKHNLFFGSTTSSLMFSCPTASTVCTRCVKVGLVYVLAGTNIITACSEGGPTIEVGVLRECTETAQGSRDCKLVSEQSVLVQPQILHFGRPRPRVEILAWRGYSQSSLQTGYALTRHGDALLVVARLNRFKRSKVFPFKLCGVCSTGWRTELLRRVELGHRIPSDCIVDLRC